MHERLLAKPPTLLSLYVRAMCKRPSAGAETPSISTLVLKTQIKHKPLSQYIALCGGDLAADALPPLYPQVLAFKLHLGILLDKKLPFPVIGLVHRNNSIEYYSPIYPSDTLTIKVSLDTYTQKANGINCTLQTQVYVSGTLKWQATSTYFYRQKTPRLPHKRAAKAIRPLHHTKPLKNWSLPANLGRQYAKITGDLNPIHLYSFIAKLFGFKTTLIHGMCVAAKATLEAQPQPLCFPIRISIQFKKPVYLPSQIAFTQSGKDFSLHPIINQTVLDSPMLSGKFETNFGMKNSNAV